MFGCDNVDSYVFKKTNDHINFKISGRYKVENRIHKSLRDKQNPGKTSKPTKIENSFIKNQNIVIYSLTSQSI